MRFHNLYKLPLKFDPNSNTYVVNPRAFLVCSYPFPSMQYRMLVDCKRFRDLMLCQPNNFH